MITPYHFDLNGDSPEVLQTLPRWSKSPMPFATCRLLYRYNTIQILSQQMNHSPFVIQMVEVKLNQAETIPFRINGSQIFLYFMLHGEVTFTLPDSSPVIITCHKTFMISRYRPGCFAFEAAAGMHTALIITIKSEWLQEGRHFFPCIVAALTENSDKPYFTLNQDPMDRKTESRLEKIYTYPKQKPQGLDGHLRKYISYILKHYDNKIEERYADLSYELKTYLDEHFCDPGLSVGFLSEYFSVTSQTLLNRQYNITIQNYYTSLRMEKAPHMMRTKTHACC
jgi:hypothetical protein